MCRCVVNFRKVFVWMCWKFWKILVECVVNFEKNFDWMCCKFLGFKILELNFLVWNWWEVEVFGDNSKQKIHDHDLCEHADCFEIT